MFAVFRRLSEVSALKGDLIVKNPPSKVFSGLVSVISGWEIFSFSAGVTVTLPTRHFLFEAMRAFSPELATALADDLLRLVDFFPNGEMKASIARYLGSFSPTLDHSKCAT